MKLAVLNSPLGSLFWFLLLPLKLLRNMRNHPDDAIVAFSRSHGHVVRVMADGMHRKLRRESLEKDLARFPDLELGTMSEATAVLERHYITLPKVITEGRFNDALDSLPPRGYTDRNGNVSFKLAEMLYGAVTTIFARVDGVYYEFDDRLSMKHEAIVAWCQLHSPVTR